MINRKLGKLTARHDKRTLQLAKYLTSALPLPPATCDWTTKVTSWPMMMNDQLGDCTCAAAGHLIELWTANSGSLIVPTDQQIVAAYEAITGYNPATGANDNGAVETDVLNYWRQNNIGGYGIVGYAALEPHNHQHVMDAVYLFGGCYIGVSLPTSAQNQTVWSVPPGGAVGDGAPGSWGGHAVPIVAYDQRGLTCITWGAPLTMTWQFWDTYCEESYAILSNNWFNGQNKAPNGFDLATLQADLSQVAN